MDEKELIYNNIADYLWKVLTKAEDSDNMEGIEDRLYQQLDILDQQLDEEV
jgi:hypothetical protein